jgi:hypothetical protein
MTEHDAAALVGTWRLKSCRATTADGTIVHPLGKNVQGRLIYEKEGRMAVQLMDPDRPAFRVDDPFVASDKEVRAAFDGYAAYYGSYCVRPDEHTVTHHIEAALNPNWVGSDKVRNFELSGDRLTLSTPAITLDGAETAITIVWERLR